VVTGGVAGDAFQCVDSAEADFQAVLVSELLDGLAESIGDLAPTSI
jgi:hypothetical protein